MDITDRANQQHETRSFVVSDLEVRAEGDAVTFDGIASVVDTPYTVRDIFGEPKMPYTLGLMNSIPRLEHAGEGPRARLQAIPGNVPNPLDLPPGCKFRPRCRFADARCVETHPALDDSGGGHMVRCLRWSELDLKGERARG